MSTVDDADSATFDAVLTLYLACSKLPDGDLDDEQARRILELTRQHTAGLAPHYGERALHDAAEALSRAATPQAKLALVVAAAEHLADALDRVAKEELVAELGSIAVADGSYTAPERDFVEAVAKTLGV